MPTPHPSLDPPMPPICAESGLNTGCLDGYWNDALSSGRKDSSYYGSWARIHVDFLSPFSFVRTFLRFTLTFASYFPCSVWEVKEIGIYVDILTKIWYSRRLRKNFLNNFVQVSLGTPVLRYANINDIFFFGMLILLKHFPLHWQSIWFKVYG